MRGQRITASSSEEERLSEYVLRELPIMTAGIQVGEVWYGLLPYPDYFSLVDKLVFDLHEGQKFSQIAKALLIPRQTALVELLF